MGGGVAEPSWHWLPSLDNVVPLPQLMHATAVADPPTGSGVGVDEHAINPERPAAATSAAARIAQYFIIAFSLDASQINATGCRPR